MSTSRLVRTQLWEYAPDGKQAHLPEMRPSAGHTDQLRRTEARDGARRRPEASAYLGMRDARRPPAMGVHLVRVPVGRLDDGDAAALNASHRLGAAPGAPSVGDGARSLSDQRPLALTLLRMLVTVENEGLC